MAMNYRRFLRKTTYLRYGIFILTVFFSYYSIRAVSNNKTIDTSIAEVQQANARLEQEILFKQNFYKSYLEWEYAAYFLGHENWQLFPWEQIIRIKKPLTREEEQQENLDLAEQMVDEDLLATPQQSWRYFVEVSLSELGDIWSVFTWSSDDE